MNIHEMADGSLLVQMTVRPGDRDYRRWASMRGRLERFSECECDEKVSRFSDRRRRKPKVRKYREHSDISEHAGGLSQEALRHSSDLGDPVGIDHAREAAIHADQAQDEDDPSRAAMHHNDARERHLDAVNHHREQAHAHYDSARRDLEPAQVQHRRASTAHHNAALMHLEAARRLEGREPNKEVFSELDRLAEEGDFTGEVKDRRGYRRCYVQGKLVHCSTIDKGKKLRREKGRQAMAKDPRFHTRRSVLEKIIHLAVTSAPRAIRRIYGRIKESAGQGHRGHRAAVMVAQIGAAVEHRAQKLNHAARSMVEEVVRQRGLDPEKGEKVRKVAGIIDTALSWTINIPLAHAGLEAAGMHGLGSFVAAKVGFYVPVASIGYLAYSTLRNPMAAFRAASALFKGKGHGEDAPAEHAEGFAEDTGPGEAQQGLTREGLEALADFIALAEGQDEWAITLVCAALDVSHDLEAAVRMAHEALEQHPEPPGGDEETGPGAAQHVEDPEGDIEDATSHPTMTRKAGKAGSPDWERSTKERERQRQERRWERRRLEGESATDHAEEDVGTAPYN